MSETNIRSIINNAAKDSPVGRYVDSQIAGMKHPCLTSDLSRHDRLLRSVGWSNRVENSAYSTQRALASAIRDAADAKQAMFDAIEREVVRIANA